MRLCAFLFIASAMSLSACGTRVPEIQEVWEPVEKISDDLKFKIRAKIYCELVDAIRQTQQTVTCGPAGRKKEACLSKDYGVQMQTTITIDESSAINPSVGFLDTLSGGSFTTNLTSTFSSAAIRVDTTYSYHNIERILKQDVKDNCNLLADRIDYGGSSMLLRADLGITKYLERAVASTLITRSQAAVGGGALAGAAKQAKFDVFSYQVKFVVVTNGGVNPVLKLKSLSTGVGNQPLVSAGRTRTHELTLTFGPGKEVPDLAALQVHSGQVLGKQQ